MDRDLLTRFTKATRFTAREKQYGQVGISWDWSPSELQEQLEDICNRKFLSIDKDLSLRRLLGCLQKEDFLLIKGRLLDRASSVFQWLKYAIRQATELLQGGESVNYILDVLEKCPQYLDDVYASLIEQIPRPETDVAFRLLEWISLAQAPVSVEALRHAICIDRPYRKGASIHDFKNRRRSCMTMNLYWNSL
ncbi:hypothetical protein KC329_g38 [Hortaea werneckii]|nr:hypothetical protein KC329_g38 [Hortaea werneckii]